MFVHERAGFFYSPATGMPRIDQGFGAVLHGNSSRGPYAVANSPRVVGLRSRERGAMVADDFAESQLLGLVGCAEHQ